MRSLLAALLASALAAGQSPPGANAPPDVPAAVTEDTTPPPSPPAQKGAGLRRAPYNLKAGVPEGGSPTRPGRTSTTSAPTPTDTLPAVAEPTPSPTSGGVPAPGTPPGARPRPRPAAAPPPAPGGARVAPPGVVAMPNAATGPAQPPPAAAPAASRGGPSSADVIPAGQAGGSARATGGCEPMEGKFLLAFNKAEILDLLEQASRWTCRNFAYTEEVVRGKITLLSKTPVTPEEAYAAFLAALNTNGIAMYQTGKYWKLVRIADAKKVPIPTLLGDDTDVPLLEQPITKLFRLRYVDPDQLRAVLGNFTSPQGADIQTIPPDILLVTDIGLNVRRIEKLLEALDRPGSNDLVRVIQVNYAPARDVADKVNQIFVQVPGQPGKTTRRPVIGGVAAPGAPGAPPAGGGAEAGEISISKVVADERTNKLIVISDEKSYQRITELVRQLDTPTAGEGSIHVIFLKNANAEDLSNTLQNLASGRRTSTGGTPPGAAGAALAQPPGVSAPRPQGGGAAELFAGDVKITADKPSNSLVIIASASDFAVVQRLVDKLDRARRQVFVEAVIMEVDISNTSDIGVGMHLAVPVNTANGKGFIPIGLEPGKINSLNPSSALQLGGFLTGLVGPVSAELKDIFPFPSVGVVIQALQTNSDVNVLSTPHLIAQDNEESEIIVGNNVPFQAGYNPGFNTSMGTTSTTGNTTNNLLASPYAVSLIAPIQRQNVDLKLKIKPQIHEGEMVRMDIEESQEEIVANDPTLGPTTAKRSVKTKVVVKDQSTIVIGGLVQDRNVTSVSKVPLLGDIPILGWAFRSTNVVKKKTNLLLLLTPYIIRDQADFRRILERKQREQRELYELYYGKKPDYTLAEASSRPGPLTRVRQQVVTENAKIENGGPGGQGEKTLKPPSYAPETPAPAQPAPARNGPKPVPPPTVYPQPVGPAPAPAPSQAPAAQSAPVQPPVPAPPASSPPAGDPRTFPQPDGLVRPIPGEVTAPPATPPAGPAGTSGPAGQ